MVPLFTHASFVALLFSAGLVFQMSPSAMVVPLAAVMVPLLVQAPPNNRLPLLRRMVPSFDQTAGGADRGGAICWKLKVSGTLMARLPPRVSSMVPWLSIGPVMDPRPGNVKPKNEMLPGPTMVTPEPMVNTPL